MGAATDHLDFIQILDVLRTSVSEKTGRIVAQVGNVVGRTVTSVNAYLMQQVGLASRPSKPQAGRASARGVVIQRGSYDVVIATEDDRGLELLGNLKDGETALYAAGETGTAQGRVLIKQDGSINIYTTHDNTKDGSSVYLRIAPDGFSWVAPWGTIKFDAMGFSVVHSSGATINLGGVGGLPEPFDAISSYIKMQASAVSKVASVVAHGPGGGAALASAPAVMQALTTLQAEVTALMAAVTAVAAGLTGPGAAAGVAAAGTAASVVVPGATTVATSITTVPTLTTSA